MAKWCLNKQYVDKFKEGLIAGLKGGELNPQKLNSLSSLERRTLLEKYVGKENAQQVNALFESKLLLKNQKAGYISWAKKVSGLSKEAKRDIISKIEKLDTVLDPKSEQVFLEDLVSTKLNLGIKADEAKQIFNLSKSVQEAKAKMKPDFTFPTKEDNLAHAKALYNLKNYIKDIKLKSDKIYFKEQPLKYATRSIKATPGFLKSMLSSFDDSYFGRQGIKTLLDPRTSHIWVKDFLKSFKDIYHQLGGTDAMALLEIDKYSRKNFLNGKYEALGKNSGLGVITEEAFPSSLPEIIPLFNRVYKASQSAYNGGALRMRMDLADRLIARAEKQGINVLDKRQGEAIGNIIGSMTGRGSLGRAEGIAQPANAVFFSIKFLKSNFDTLTAHQFDSTATAFTKSEARKNLLAMIGTIAGVMTISETLNPGSTELDPRSTNFGKIKVFGRWVDITGGMGSLVTLASRITPSIHNNEWGFWTKTESGYRKLNQPGYGQETALDTAENYLEGKFSPGLGLVRDLWKGQNYSGQSLDLNNPKQTAINIVKGTTIPISFQTYLQMQKDPQSSNKSVSFLLELLGFSGSQNTYPTNWDTSSSNVLKQFRQQVGDKKFKEANDKFNQDYEAWLEKTKQNPKYQDLSDEDKQALITKEKEAIKQDIFKSYKFKYKTEKKTSSKKNIEKSLLP